MKVYNIIVIFILYNIFLTRPLQFSLNIITSEDVNYCKYYRKFSLATKSVFIGCDMNNNMLIVVIILLNVLIS